ncbi:MAG: DUF58 domain-containing protein [Chloroflexi bacterium]|nr:MAG: DUF58 domain-containing protein [Chloroflexota bacterium]
MNRRWYYVGVAILLVSLLIHQPLLFLLGLLVLLILGTADIWAKFCMHDLRYSREFSEKRVLFGEEITLSISLENAKLLPLPWLEIEETVPRSLTFTGRSLRMQLSSNAVILESLFSLHWYERVTRRYTVYCNARGVHAFGPTTLRSGDVYGFQSRQESFANRQYLLVYPMVVPITRFGLPARHPFGDYKTPRRLLEDPSRVIGVREYMYGDDLRRVHWKATARMMQLQSKVYQPTTTYTLVIFLNAVSQLDVWYGIHPELQELAICAAASIASWALDEGLAVGLYANTTMYTPEVGMTLPAQTNGSEETKETKPGSIDLQTVVAEQLKRRRISLPPASNEEQRKRIMEVLARIQAYFGASIEDLVQAERTRLPAGATVVVITSTISDPLLDTLARVAHAGHAVTLLLVGDTPMSIKLAGVTVYHLGGEDAWKQLLASYEGATNRGSTGEMGEQLGAINRAPTGSFTF